MPGTYLKDNETNCKLSLVIPLFNEQDNIERLVGQLFEVLKFGEFPCELVLVNNGSRDNTNAEIDAMIQKHGDSIRKVVVPVNRGFGWGVISGLRTCRGKVVGFMVGDLEADTSIIMRAYHSIRMNPLTVAKACRNVRHDGIARKLLSLAYNTLFRIRYQVRSKDVNGTPKLFSLELLQRLDLRSNQSFLDAELLLKASYLGCRIIEFPTESRKRPAGKSHVDLRLIRSMFFDLVAFGLRKNFRRWRHEMSRARIELRR